MKHTHIHSALIGTVLIIAGCGGGNGGKPSDNTGSPDQPPVTFNLTLTEIEVRRSSNAEPISVDTTGINSGTLRWHGASSSGN